MSQYAHLSTPDPEFSVAISNLPDEAVHPPLDIYVLRKFSTLRAAARSAMVSFSETQLKVDELNISVNDGEIPIRTYVPQPTEGERFPVLFWMHGGGFALGDLDSDDAMLQKLATDLRISIVNVGYRLAPEFTFPTGLNDSYEALKWTSVHAPELNADITKGFVLGGISAGANFATILAHRARDDPMLRDKLTGQILQIPTVVHMEAVPERYKGELLSMEQNKHAPQLPRTLIDLFFDKYGIPDPADPEMSPLLFPSHRDLPPAYFQVCGLDPLRDEGLLYEKILKDQGNKTRLDVYPGVSHGFQNLCPTIKQAVKWEQDVRDGIRWLLNTASV